MKKEPRNYDELRKAVQQGKRFRYLFFWGHRPCVPGQLDEACLSQWWPARFTVDGVIYPSAEHFMMAGKARLFGDEAALDAVQNANSPAAAKKVGRTVSGFNEDQWQEYRYRIVVQGNLAKFSQNPALAAYLHSTGRRVLAEASPYDRIWGIGLAADAPQADNPLQWPGLNLLGFALMDVRRQLAQT